jgi:hypothetical protein
MHSLETRLKAETAELLLLSPFEVSAENKTVQIYQPSNNADVRGVYDEKEGSDLNNRFC